MMLIILFIFLLVVLVFILLERKLYKNQQIWNIVLFRTDGQGTLFSFLNYNYFKRFSPTLRIRTSYHYVIGYADPFLFAREGWLYLFYEEERLQAPAAICAKRTKDLRHWESIGIVLQEPFHLSFPFVFEYEGMIYMLPETRHREAVILYKAIGFPNRWEPIVLLSGDKFVDSSILFHESKWYLFTTVWYGHQDGLRLYVSDQLESGWKEHPLSPVTNDLHCARCGGAVLKIGAKMYRPAQDCSDYYGEYVVSYEITELTPTKYHEEKRVVLIDKQNKWSRYGGHHYNTASFKDNYVVAMDGIIDDNSINNHTRKLFNWWENRHES